MAKFIIEATRTTTYRDEVEAESLEQAIAITDGWIADDFTEVGNRWDLDVKENM